MQISPVIMVLADISGYTRFVRLNAVSVLHAEMIITDLLEAITQQARFPLELNRLEGDAAFLFSEVKDADPVDAVADIADQITNMMAAFKSQHADLLEKSAGGCICRACRNLDKLRLKVIAHYGDTVIKCVGEHIEMGGEAPIIIHRLAKNHIDSDEYVLVTDAFAKFMKKDLYPNARSWIEGYDDIGDIQCRAFFPDHQVTKKAGVLE